MNQSIYRELRQWYRESSPMKQFVAKRSGIIQPGQPNGKINVSALKTRCTKPLKLNMHG